MAIDRRTFIVAGAAAGALPSRLAGQPAHVFHPEDFGARGDGKTNDTRAFAALSAEVNRRGGGTIALRAGRTYVVGSQSRGGDKFGWNPDPILALEGLGAPLTILGNGARLRCQPGLRFGSFDAGSGARADHPMPNRNRSDLASPYRAMISVKNCRSSVEIRDIELDGNSAALSMGGRFGDKGWQVPASGLLLNNNSGSEVIEGVYSHHHALDGATFIGDPGRSTRSRVTKLVTRYNGRQGLSITGGRGFDFADCEFSHTGRAAVRSAPTAGVDIEAEGRPIRDLSFTRCKFLDNAGAGLTVPVGNSEDVRFTECLFVGTTNWSAWPNKPHLVFTGCTFVGAMVHAYGDSDPARATRFTSCRFTDDASLSPTGQVYLGGAGQAPIVSLVGPNVMFDGCRFDLIGSGTLPQTPPTAIYRNCKMSQRSPRVARVQGRFQGTTTIDGPARPSGTIEGSVTLNGRPLPRGAVGGNARPE
jgi:hypothetical protein